MRHPVGGYQLAQVNVGVPLEPLDSERLRGFVEQLEPVNALADAAPGFVWRLQTEEGDATSLQPDPANPDLIINMSVWESTEALTDFVYRGHHAAAMRGRREWFVPMREAFTCAWWIPAGTRPTMPEAMARLDLLRASGPCRQAFTLQRPFPRPDLAPAVPN
ncbi:DUF3291 domain-containing protein [Jatrophihabitans sp. YIM 134969]